MADKLMYIPKDNTQEFQSLDTQLNEPTIQYNKIRKVVEQANKKTLF